MDLRQLKTFLKVAELGSLSRASDQMRIVQPALSRQIRLLEKEAGAPLFIRKSTGMKLTAAGKELSRRISEPVRQIDHALTDMKSLSESTSGRVNIAMLTTVSYALAGRVACRVAEEFPEISLRITEGYSSHITEWLQRGEVDAAITYGPGADFHLTTHDLLVEELVVVGSPFSDLSPEKPVMVSELGQLPLVLPSPPNALRLIVERSAAKAKQKLNVKIEADSFRALKELVAHGIGFTILPLSSLFREQRKGEFKYAHLKRPKMTRQLILVRPLDSELSRAAKAVVNIAMEELVKMLRAGDLIGHLLFNASSPGSWRPIRSNGKKGRGARINRA